MTKYASKWGQWLITTLIAVTTAEIALAREDIKDGFFNCSSPLSSPVEELVCKNGELLTLNTYGQVTYKKIMDGLRLYPERQSIVDPAELTMGQTQWTTLAFNTCPTVQCVQKELSEKVDELIDLAHKLQTTPSQSSRRPQPSDNAQTIVPTTVTPARSSDAAASKRGDGVALPSRIATSMERAVLPGNPVEASQYMPTEQKSDRKLRDSAANNWAWKIGISLLLLNLVITLIQARKNTIVLFSNYTDIAMTLAAPAVALPLAILLGVLGFSDIWSWSISGLVAGVLALMVALHTCKANDSGLAFVMALVAKFTLLLASLLIALIAMAVLLGGGERKKYERQKSYEQRRSRETATTVAAGVGLFAYLAHLVCPDRRFIPINEYLSVQAQGTRVL